MKREVPRLWSGSESLETQFLKSFGESSLQTILPPPEPKPHLTLYDFIVGGWHIVEPGREFVPNWHIVVICLFLEALAYGKLRRLVINIPPGFMKSLSCCAFFPAWVWGFVESSYRFIYGSYGQDLSDRDSVRCRDIVLSDWYRSVAVNAVILRGDRSAVRMFQNTDTGSRLATSVGGMGTGARADFIGFDDPIKVGDADSETAREFALNWWSKTMSSRGSDPKTARFFGIAQRTHWEDVAGWCLDRGYDYLILPAERIPDFQVTSRPDLLPPGILDEYERSGLLWEAMYGWAELAEIKEDLGSHAYAAQYQQQPVPHEGGLVKLSWFKRYRVPPAKFDTLVLSCDTAGKREDSNDPWALLLWGVLKNEYYLLHVVCQRFEYPEGKRFLTNHILDRRPATVLIEDASSGTFLIQELRQDRKLRTSVIGLKPCREKIVRMKTASPIIEAGRVWLPESADWVAAYETELAQFPRGAHDDMVDATSQFLRWADGKFHAPRQRKWEVAGDRSERMEGWY